MTASYQGCECDPGAVLLLLIFKILLMCVCMMCIHGHSTHGGQRNSFVEFLLSFHCMWVLEIDLRMPDFPWRACLVEAVPLYSARVYWPPPSPTHMGSLTWAVRLPGFLSSDPVLAVWPHVYDLMFLGFAYQHHHNLCGVGRVKEVVQNSQHCLWQIASIQEMLFKIAKGYWG